jgi:hypothetical protein
MGTYSFQDVTAALVGIGGAINLASGAGAAEEGITVEAVGDKSAMTIGADGSGMHSLSADESSTATIRLLKTSPVNAQLMLMYNLQTRSSVAHGKNVITIRDTARGDTIVLVEAAFKKRPAISYAKDGGTVEWVFDCIKTVQLLGIGVPAI